MSGSATMKHSQTLEQSAAMRKILPSVHSALASGANGHASKPLPAERLCAAPEGYLG